MAKQPVIPPHRATPEMKKHCWRMVEMALESGQITRGQCEVKGCGRFYTEAHHDDYAYPLRVRWICRQHHLVHHRS